MCKIHIYSLNNIQKKNEEMLNPWLSYGRFLMWASNSPSALPAAQGSSVDLSGHPPSMCCVPRLLAILLIFNDSPYQPQGIGWVAI